MFRLLIKELDGPVAEKGDVSWWGRGVLTVRYLDLFYAFHSDREDVCAC